MILLSASFRSLMQLIGVLIIFVFVLIITYFTTKWVGGFHDMKNSQENFQEIFSRLKDHFPKKQD